MSVSETEEDVKEIQQLEDKTTDTDLPVHEQKGDLVEEQPKQLSPDHEEKALKKYGGLLPKKHPLISKDHERAFFDSADWALGKQQGGAQKPKGPLEALRPKLEPTQHQQLRSRRSVYAPADDDDNDHTNQDGNNECHEDQHKATEKTQNTKPPDAEGTEEGSSSCH